MTANELRIELSRDAFLDPFVGGPAFRLRQVQAGGLGLADALAEMEHAPARFAHVRVQSDDDEAAGALTAAGFDHVETLVTWRLALVTACPNAAQPGNGQTGRDRTAAEHSLREARPEDLAACRRIAEDAFVYNRFSRDPHMNPDAARSLKGEWMMNNFGGRADTIIVVLVQGDVSGFIACLLQGHNAVIDLVAVAPEHQGAGLGRTLLDAAAAAYAGRAEGLHAGTQAANAPSMHMYQSAGFAPIGCQETFHLWSPA